MFLKFNWLQSYGPSKLVIKNISRPFGFEATFFSILYSESLLSERPGFDSQPAQTLRAYNFEILGLRGPKITFFEKSDLSLLVEEKIRGFEVF